MANPPQNKVPPRSGGGRPPRPQAPRRPNKRNRRRYGSRRYLYTGVIGAIIIAAAIVVPLLVTGGSGKGPQTSQSAIDWKTPAGLPVYGKLGPENVPLEVGPELAPPNAGLTGQPIDGIQCNASEQIAYHHHVHLVFFVNGKPYSMPLGVGFVPPAEVQNTPKGPFAEGSPTCLYWTHVHAGDGILHIESPEARDFVLGQVFDVWGVKLSANQLGSFTGPVTATVNGKPWAGDVREIPLSEHAQIVLNLGTPVITPPPISWSGTGL